MERQFRKTLMMTESHFPGDPRPRKEAYILTRSGYKVSVICLKEKEQKSREVIDGIVVYRIPELTIFQKEGKPGGSRISKALERVKSVAGYFLEYVYFTASCLAVSAYVLVREGFDVVHAHNPPDTLFIVGAVYRIIGKKFVFDHHDLSPELYLTRFSGKRDIPYRVLVFCEKLSCKLANLVICTNQSYKQIEMDRHGIREDRIYVVRNNPIVNDFNTGNVDEPKDRNGKKNILFLGSINPQDGLDVLLRSVHILVNDLKMKNVVCSIIGDGDAMPMVRQLVRDMELEQYIELTGAVYDRAWIRDMLAGADVCVEPAPDNYLNRHSTFIKIMEYMAASKPIVAFDLKETRYSADGSALLVPPGDIHGFALGIKNLLEEPDLCKRLGKSGLRRVREELNWENAAETLLKAYGSLLRDARRNGRQGVVSERDQ